jgi:hypothetical protein
MIELPDAYENVTAAVIDGTGKQVFQESNLNGMATLNLRHLSTGSYILQLETEDTELMEYHSIQIVR